MKTSYPIAPFILLLLVSPIALAQSTLNKSFKFSVTVPESVDMAAASSFSQVQNPAFMHQDVIIEEIVRDERTILLKTVVAR